MALILDTCALLSLVGLVDRRLSPATLQAISITDAVYVSSCSIFEMAIKHKRKTLDLSPFKDAQALWAKAVKTYELTEVAVTSEAFHRAVLLPDHHQDPFDRIMIAEALRLHADMVTFDRVFKLYGVSVLA